MVCYGGDGTLLEGVHRLCGAPIPVMGINAGHLGFLTSAPSAGLNLIFEEVAAGRLTTEPRSMIEATGDYAEQPGGQFRMRSFWREIAVSYGLGFRLNFDYFILRLDGGMKAIHPAYDDVRHHYPIIHPDFKRDFTLHFAVGLPF